MTKIIIISAPSGSGKTTIVKEVMKHPELNLNFSISATTRKKRDHEQNGIDYYFLSVDEFKNKIKNNEFIEWQEVYKNQFYGTLKSEIDRLTKQGKNIIFDVDVKGAVNLKNIFKDKALAIFIKAPSLKEIENRLRKRGTETEESIKKRLARATEEMKYENKFDIVILNEDLDTAVNQTLNAIKNFITY